MKHSTLFPIVLLLILVLISCQDDLAYHREIDSIRTQRFQELRAPFGWPSVVALYPLDSTSFRFGALPDDDLYIPYHKPISIGRLLVIEDGVWQVASKQLPIRVNDTLFHEGYLRDDLGPEGPTICQLDHIQWHIIKRKDQYFLRVKDSLSQYRQAFDTLSYWPTNKKYRVTSTLVPSSTLDSVYYNNELGQHFAVAAIGQLKFHLDGRERHLSLLDGGSERYFVIVADKTNGDESYAGGRYLYPKKVDEAGRTEIDFNELINPPCIFTPFATCPLPPKENMLDIAIPVGKKYVQLY